MSASGGGQQFCLRWNSFHSNLATSFHALRSDGEFVDVTLAAEGQLIKAHRVVLSACSPFFKKILMNTPCHHPVVVLHEVRAAHVRGLLRFMYRGQVNVTQDQMAEFLQTARSLHVKGLFEEMERQQQEATVGTRATLFQPPPSPMDERTGAKRSEPPVEPPASVAKRARVPSPLATVLESTVKIEPPSSPPLECRLKEESDDGAGLNLPGACDEPALSAAPSAESASRVGTRSHQPTPSQEAGRGHPPVPPERPRAGGGQPAASTSSAADPDYVVTHTTNQYPCPFCEKSYNSWGFRRRHIKGFHTSGKTLKCKWCWQAFFSHMEWCSHVTKEHHLSTGDVQHALQILDEANLVLQSSEPLRLESLVKMVKRQQRQTSTSPETALQGTASS